MALSTFAGIDPGSTTKPTEISDLFTSRRGGARGRRRFNIAGRMDVMISITSARTVSATLIAVMLSVTTFDRGAAAGRTQRETAVYVYGAKGPNRSYQAGPRTRIFVTKRSWLDGGTEVLPGERKFSDYAFPPNYSFARENNNRPLDRQPLYPLSDMGGSSHRIPF